ncbi:MAG: glutathione S-transferase family protein [Alphaproteobacteria bacterium]|nr:glutathione S-transferase family protein [Alphaproteobacteria bacterium]
MSARRLVLYGSPHSQFTYKVGLMLALCGAPFSFRYVSFRARTHKTPGFRAISRFGQVPVLCHDREALVQAGAILEYLADLLGQYGGHETRERRDIREWLFWDTDRLGPPIYHSYGIKLGAMGLLPIKADPSVIAHHRERAATALALLDDRLSGRRFVVGDRLTIADLACYGDVAFARRSDVDVGGWPNIASWCGRIAERPQVRPPLDLLPMADAEFD